MLFHPGFSSQITAALLAAVTSFLDDRPVQSFRHLFDPTRPHPAPAPAQQSIPPYELLISLISFQLIGMPQAAAAAAVHGKDPSTVRPAALPLKLLRPLLLVAVLGTGFLAAVALLVGGPAYSSALPRPPVALPPAPPSGGGKQPLERWARAPASAWHNMTDDELLWAASWRPSVRRYPYRRTPKVAFMFLTRGPLPLAPLWERFFAGAGGGDAGLFSVYVHATPGYRPDFAPASAFYRRQVPSQVRTRATRARTAASSPILCVDVGSRVSVSL
jgi:hypothetical protein